jgi:hypothetical protein
MTYALLTAAAIVFCIFLEWKWHINMGLSAAVIAFLIGCFGLGLSPGDLKNMLPIKIIFPITAITTFYGFALDNGTLLKVVQHVIYRFRSRPGAIPVMLFCLCVLLGIAGMDAGSITAIMAPIAMSIAALGDQPVLPYAVTTLLAAAVGSNYMFATGGAIMRGLIEETVFSESAFGISLSIFLYNLLCYAVLFLITIFLFRNRGERPDVAKPEPLERRQKINLIMIGLFVVAVALPSILSEVTGSNVLKALAKKADVGFIALVFALAATLFRLGDINTIIKTRVPVENTFHGKRHHRIDWRCLQSGHDRCSCRSCGKQLPRVACRSAGYPDCRHYECFFKRHQCCYSHHVSDGSQPCGYHGNCSVSVLSRHCDWGQHFSALPLLHRGFYYAGQLHR